MISKDLIISCITSSPTSILVQFLVKVLDEMMLIFPENLGRYLKDHPWMKRMFKEAFARILMFLMRMTTADISLMFSKDLISSSINHGTLELIVIFLELLVVHKVMLMLPEELRAFLNDESTESTSSIQKICIKVLKKMCEKCIKWMCTCVIQCVLTFLRRPIKLLWKIFYRSPCKKFTSLFKKKELREPTCAL